MNNYHLISNTGKIGSIYERVDKLFENLNFLKLKQTIKVFLDLEDEVLEKFSEKYSGILIYLLNMTDQKTSKELIHKLTKNSVLYLVEEEVRLLLLGTFKNSGVLEDIEKITQLFEELDFSKNQNFLIKRNYREIQDSLRFLYHQQAQKTTTLRFRYLLNLEEGELWKLMNVITEKKPIIIPILMIFALDEIRFQVLKFIFTEKKEFIHVLVSEMINLKFFSLIRNYINIEELSKEFSVEFSSKLKSLETAFMIEKTLGKHIEEIQSDSNLSVRQKRDKILNEVYLTIKNEEADTQEIIIADLLNKNILSINEVELLELILKEK
ncbi:MAG: hypothetical protein NZ853_06125 [Leptospiraceae bacterium]|nr:hypothetical protein [Leptospiraceae bacterium]MDW7976472.1 hypothetical protein [Leptospiraceae bacterium]